MDSSCKNFVLFFLTQAILVAACGISCFGAEPESPEHKASANAWPNCILSNGVLRAVVALPDREKGYYRGNRFELAGIITSLTSQGHEFFREFNQETRAPERTTSGLGVHDAAGTAEEFMDPVGYEGAPAGSAFLKIGRGVFVKESSTKKYHFGYSYTPLQLFKWKFESTERTITFMQSVETPYGWKYEYTKTIALLEHKPVLQITHTLKNLGEKQLASRQYCHNFILIDGVPPGPEYEIEFGYYPSILLPPEKIVAQITPYLHFSNSIIQFKKETGDKQIIVPLGGFTNASEATFGLRNQTRGASIQIRVSEKPINQVLCILSGKNGICVENFIEVKIQPGETKSWTRSYQFYAFPPVRDMSFPDRN